ncbi:MAG: tetratricopeptide repeat protein [Saprospiraceae bacterium]
MNHIRSIYLVLIFSLATVAAWGQTPDTIAGKKSGSEHKTVVTDRMNEPEDRERGPSLRKILAIANESFDKKNYYAALKYYSFVLKSEPLRPEALKGYGESALAISALDSAESAFQRMVNHGLSPAPDYFPKMRLAEAKFRKGDYDGAFVLYNEMATLPQTPSVPNEVKKEATARGRDCEWALNNLDLGIVQPASYTILDTFNVNTRAFSEYVAYPDKDQLYFSAYRFEFKNDKANPNRHLIKLLAAKGADAKLGPDEKMPVAESDFNDLKRQHTAHLTYDESGNAAYYALGNYHGRDSAEVRLDLYRRKKQSDGAWGLPEKLGAVNAAGFTTTEPTIGRLPGEKNETLFFVSDRPGGEGGRDIWHSRIIGDSLSAPQPLADINTKGDDVTPFYHSRSNTLYFSTDGTDTLLRTIGGFDVYKSKRGKNGFWGKPKHMGTPINSSANDVFFVLNNESNRAYFSNNLRGSSNDSEEGCCYDIYSVDVCTPKLKAIAYHDLTKGILPLTRVTLYEEGAYGQLTPIADPQPDTASTYLFDVELEKNYVLIAEKADFSADTLAFNIPDSTSLCVDLVKPLYLRPHINLIATVYDCDTGEPINGATAKFFAATTPKGSGNFAAFMGDGTTDVLPEATNRQDYEIDFEHKYQVNVYKEGYMKPDTSEVVSTVGRITGGTIEVRLFLQRPEPDFKPIPLYFDNDYPTPNSWDTTTVLQYQPTFNEYMRKKEPVFLKEYCKGLKGAKRTADSLKLDDFFEKEVRANFYEFLEYSFQIETWLDSGYVVEVTIRGYASPLAKGKTNGKRDYNTNLTSRRISSIYNHFRFFRSTNLMGKYYKEDNSGQLKIYPLPNGDKFAPDGVVFKPSNRREAVYSVEASRERRVEIVGVRKFSKDKKDCETETVEIKTTTSSY